MAQRAPRLSIAAIVLCLSAAAVRAEVRDDAHMFGRQAVDDADAVLGQVQKQYGKQLVVETMASVPADERAAALADKAAYFDALMAAHAKGRRANGVYVLICLDPKYVQVGAGVQTRERGIFTAADVNALRRGLQRDLRAQRYDAALLGAVQTVIDAYAAHVPGARPLVPTPAPTSRPTTGPAVER